MGNEEQRHRELIEGIPAVLLIVVPGDPWSVLYAGPQVEDLLGIAAAEIVADGSKWLDRIHAGDRDRVIQACARHMATGEPLTTDFRMIASSGDTIWVTHRSSVARDDKGVPVYSRGVIIDVTDRKVETERSTALVKNTVDLILVATPGGEVRWASSSVGRTLRFEPDRFHRSLVHPNDLEAYVETFRAVSAEPGSTRGFTVRLKNADGTWHDFEGVMSNMLHDPNIEGIVVNAHDVTERNSAERVRGEAEERFRIAFDNAPIGMALVGTDGRFLQVNGALCDITGYEEPELLSKTFHEITHAEDLPGDLESVALALEGKVRTYRREKRYFHSSGRIVWALINVSLVRDGEGRPLYFVSQIEDVTERRRLEEQLRQAQKMEAVGQLAGGIAHDFNNILSIIQSYARFVVEALNPADPIRVDVEEIVNAGDRAAALVRQLLAFSRREISIPVVLDINEGIGIAEKLLRRTIGENIQLVTELQPGVPQVVIDSGSLEQVVMNIAINARDAMPDGGRLTIRTQSIDLAGDDPEWPALQAGTYAQMSISDTGSGMGKEVLNRIFEPFFTTKSRGRGTGLGLATVYAIVKQAGGDISVRSQPNLGTNFTILLPAGEDLSGERTKVGLDQMPAGNDEAVLVVEDEDGVRRLVHRILSRNGYRVLLASSGAEAIELSRGPDSIDLLLTDVIMPEMSGVTLAATLLSEKPDLRIIFMSGYPDEIVAHHGVLDKAEMYLQKPFTATELLTKVRTTLDSRSAQRLPSKPEA